MENGHQKIIKSSDPKIPPNFSVTLRLTSFCWPTDLEQEVNLVLFSIMSVFSCIVPQWNEITTHPDTCTQTRSFYFYFVQFFFY